MKVKVKGEKNETCIIWLEMFDSIQVNFSQFSYLETYVYVKQKVTHSKKQDDDYRQQICLKTR